MSSTSAQPEQVLNETFFDQLWPLILDENICDIHSKNTSPYFVPQRSFDQLWAHELLAKQDYGQYEPPIDFTCGKGICAGDDDDDDDDDKNAESADKRTSIELDDGAADKGEFERGHKIKSLCQQIAEINAKEKWRQNLAYEFVNRTHPWYMPKPSYVFELTNDLLSVFEQPFERDLIRAIHMFSCRCLIINLSAEICWLQIEKWVKFCKFLNILIVVHKEELIKRLVGLHDTIMTMLFQADRENTWQQELTRALDQAVEFALANKLLANCADSFIYVFSSQLDANILDRFKVLRKA